MSIQGTDGPAESVSIPLGVKSAYAPSGGFAPGRLLWLIVGGIVGLLVGVLCVIGVAAVGALGFWMCMQDDECPIFFFLLVFFIYYAAPIMLPIMSGLLIGKFTRPAKCRSLRVGHVVGAVFAVINIPLILIIGKFLRDFAYVYMNISLESMSFISPDTMQGTTGFITMAAIALSGLLITPSMIMKELQQQKFCERCHNYLKREVYSRVSLLHVPNLLEALAQLDLAQVAAVPKLTEKPKWTSTDERVDVILYSCPCQATSFIEAEIVWTEVSQGSKTGHRRLIFSAFLNPEATRQLEAPAAPVVPAGVGDGPTLPPAAPPVDLAAQEFEAQRRQQFERQEEQTGKSFRTRLGLRVGAIMVMAGIFGLYSLYKTADYYSKVHYPTIPGTITAVAEGKFIEDRVTITTPDGKKYLAMLRQKSFKQVGRQVQFHYSGKPEAEVLVVGEENPLYFTLFLLAMASICFAILYFTLRKKRPAIPPHLQER